MLDKAGVPADMYCVDGGLPNERPCIEQSEAGTWRTYYSERGLRSDLKEFATEDEACDYFFHWVVNSE